MNELDSFVNYFKVVDEFMIQSEDTLVIDNYLNIDKFLNCITCDSKFVVDIRFYRDELNYKLSIFFNLKHISTCAENINVSHFIEDYHDNLYISGCAKLKSSKEYSNLKSICGLNKIVKLNRLMIKGK